MVPHTITNPLMPRRCEEIAWHIVVKTYIKPLVGLFKTLYTADELAVGTAGKKGIDIHIIGIIILQLHKEGVDFSVRELKAFNVRRYRLNAHITRRFVKCRDDTAKRPLF